MKVDKNLIKHVANIARISLTEKEIEKFLPQFEEILNLFSEIEEIEGSKELAIHPYEIENQFREDIVEDSIKNPLSNAKHKENNFIKGPKIK